VFHQLYACPSSLSLDQDFPPLQGNVEFRIGKATKDLEELDGNYCTLQFKRRLLGRENLTAECDQTSVYKHKGVGLFHGLLDCETYGSGLKSC